jgi:hypothetical protein
MRASVLGDVGEPDPVGRVGAEVALDEVVVGGRLGLPVAVLALVADSSQTRGRISRATRLRPHTSPNPSRSSACTRGEPWVPRES